MLLISRNLRIPTTSFPRTSIAIAVTTSQFRLLSYSSTPSNTMPPSPPPPPPNTAATKPPSPSLPSNPKPQSPLRLSSSLLLLSPTNQILLVQRSHSKSMSFSSAIVFPGGNLDSTHDSFLLPSTSPQLPLPKTLPLSSNQLDIPEDLETALKTCAIRETFEETGILLAHPTSRNSSSTSTGVDADTLRSARQNLLNRDNQKPFSQVLKDLQLRITPEELHPFTTWITPPNIPKRYRASMFLTFLPIDSPPIELDPPVSISDEAGGSGNGGGEIAQARWIHPRDLLNLYHAQSKAPSPSSSASKKPRLILFPPQYFLLTHLAHSIERNPSSAQAARDHLLHFTGYEHFSRQVIQPYTKRVLGEEEGKDKGKVLVGLDRPRGDMNQWIKVKFGKDGPSEVELVKRWKDGKETVEEGRGENTKAKL